MKLIDLLSNLCVIFISFQIINNIITVCQLFITISNALNNIFQCNLPHKKILNELYHNKEFGTTIALMLS